MANKIGICGHCYVGKTTVGKELSQRLGYDFISIGDHCRENGIFERITDDWELNDYVQGFVTGLLQNPRDLIIDGRTICQGEISPKSRGE
ncbi:unnamed protein product, partial [marine sediment metagenome]